MKEAHHIFGHLRNQMMNMLGNERDQLLADLIEQLRPKNLPPRMLMNWEEVSRWLDLGPAFEVGVHTRTHTDLTLLSNDAILNEISHCVDELSKKCGVTSPHFAYPYGRSNDRTASVLRSSRCQSALETEPMERVDVGSDKFTFTRINAVCSVGKLGFVTSGAYPEMLPKVLGR
jgi:peptidoglycan/xylan/chitin deacetylase (PgdA/CDA1 family)